MHIYLIVGGIVLLLLLIPLILIAWMYCIAGLLTFYRQVKFRRLELIVATENTEGVAVQNKLKQRAAKNNSALPSAKQISFATAIASTLNIPLPQNIEIDRNIAHAFIARHVKAWRQQRERNVLLHY